MGKGSQSSTTTVKQELSPEQRQIMQSTMDRYMPGGKFGDKPQFNPSEHRWMGEQRNAAFTPDQQAAFEATRRTAFEHRPAMEWSARAAVNSAGPTGQKMGLGRGWSTGANGTANFRDWNSGTASDYMNPYKQNVVDTGLEEFRRAHDVQQLDVNDAAMKAGAFGGSRHGVQAAETTEGFGRQMRGFMADTLDKGYQQARGEYDSDRAFGQDAVGWNKKVDDDNMARLSSASDRVAGLAKQNQELNGQAINAIGSVGDAVQDRDQRILDSSYDELMNKYLWSAQLGQMLSGFTPPPTTTQTQRTSGGGSIWGSIGSAALGGLTKMLPMMMSDENAKENVEEVDPEEALKSLRKLANKGMYAFDYNDDAKSKGAPEGRRTGFMAQDYAEATGKENPEINGYQHVDVMEALGRLTHAVVALDRKVVGKRAA